VEPRKLLQCRGNGRAKTDKVGGMNTTVKKNARPGQAARGGGAIHILSGCRVAKHEKESTDREWLGCWGWPMFGYAVGGRKNLGGGGGGGGGGGWGGGQGGGAGGGCWGVRGGGGGGGGVGGGGKGDLGGGGGGGGGGVGGRGEGFGGLDGGAGGGGGGGGGGEGEVEIGFVRGGGGRGGWRGCGGLGGGGRGGPVVTIHRGGEHFGGSVKNPKKWCFREKNRVNLWVLEREGCGGQNGALWGRGPYVGALRSKPQGGGGGGRAGGGPTVGGGGRPGG